VLDHRGDQVKAGTSDTNAERGAFSIMCFAFSLAFVVSGVGKFKRVYVLDMPALEALDYFRPEFFFYSSVALGFTSLWHLASTQRGRASVLYGAAVLSTFLISIEVVGNTYHLATGDEGFDFALALHSILHINDFAPVLASVLTSPARAVGGLLLLILVGPFYLFGAWRKRKIQVAPTRAMSRRASSLAFAFAVLTLTLSILPGAFDRNRGSQQALIVNAVVLTAQGIWGGNPDAPPIRPGFATQAEFVAKDHTEPRGKARNIVIIILESVRAASSSLYRDKPDITPYLAELGANSAVMENAFALLTHTSKSLVSILCGVEGDLHRPVREAEVEGGIPARCLSSLLDDHGYATLYMQSAIGSFESRDKLIRNMRFQDFIPSDDLDHEGFEQANYFGYEDRILLEPNRKWLEAHRGESIFASYLLNTPHHQYLAPEHYGSFDFAEEEELNRYQNSVYYVDQVTREIIQQYKDLGLYQDTVFFILGDHGEGFGEHGARGHNAIVYNEGLKIPFLIHDGRDGRGGGNRGARRIPSPVSVLDILPTVAGILGFDIRGAEYPGRDLFGESRPNPVFGFCWAESQCMAMIDENWKFIDHFGLREDELFRLDLDPEERENLLDVEPARSSRMKRDSKRWRDGVRSFYRNYYNELLTGRETDIRIEHQE
jgi:lipoteichoic acid synthase